MNWTNPEDFTGYYLSIYLNDLKNPDYLMQIHAAPKDYKMTRIKMLFSKNYVLFFKSKVRRELVFGEKV